MQNTEHLNLNLPEATDVYDIGNENENMEILDSSIYNHGILLGTGSAAGHNKIIDNLNKTSLTNGEALSAHMGNSLGAMMAPIVTGPNYPSGITKKGNQFVYNGRLCVVTANTVSTSTAINIGSSGNANYASPITSQIEVITNQANDMNNVLGAKNLLPIDYPSSTKNGITFTVNADGSITANGTATAQTTFQIVNKSNLPSASWESLKNIISGKAIILNGCPSGGSASTYFMRKWGQGSSGTYTDYGDGVEFTPTESSLTDYNWDIEIVILSGQTINNLTFKPMIRLASITDNTYVPYAKSNKELTDAVEEINSHLGTIDYEGAGAHNSIYRGKYLGAEVTAEQYTAISSGKFTDLYIGDYWTIGGVNYRIGVFDYWLRTGDTECTAHHVLLVPDTNLASGQINSTNTTEGGYAGSDLKTGANDNTTLATARSTIISAFGSSHILSHREYFTNAVADGKPSAVAWYDSDIDLMNENMVYGTNIFLPHSDGNTVPKLYTIDKTQIRLFAQRPDLITNRALWWLRDVVSATSFAFVGNYGDATYTTASHSYGVRPAFAIKG